MRISGTIGTAEAAQILGVTDNHIRWLLKHRKIRGRKFGKVWMVNRESVEQYARSTERRKRNKNKKQ